MTTVASRRSPPQVGLPGHGSDQVRYCSLYTALHGCDRSCDSGPLADLSCPTHPSRKSRRVRAEKGEGRVPALSGRTPRGAGSVACSPRSSRSRCRAALAGFDRRSLYMPDGSQACWRAPLLRFSGCANFAHTGLSRTAHQDACRSDSPRSARTLERGGLSPSAPLRDVHCHCTVWSSKRHSTFDW